MAVVAERKIGSTVVRIHDDCCRDVPIETAKQAVRRICEQAQAILSEAPPQQSAG